MVQNSGSEVCVIIAAFNAASTIGSAVASALAEPEVSEVVVVDDASTDDSDQAAMAADDGSRRLKVVRQSRNAGPSAARNLGIAISRAPRIAILDSDDLILPGRFAALAAAPVAELVADNILFVDPDRAPWPPIVPVTMPADFTDLSLATFVQGNIAHRKRPRGELGFLKPVLSRAFLDGQGLRYDESIRLGEDYDLYVRMMMRGARFLATRRIGYAAQVRAASLSGQHRTRDLLELYRASRRHLDAIDPSDPAFAMIRRHARQVRGKFLYRDFLDRKSENGLLAAAAFALWPPGRVWTIGSRVAQDKLHLVRPLPAQPQYTLFQG